MSGQVDYMNPIIADADTGHGGLTATMKLTKLSQPPQGPLEAVLLSRFGSLRVPTTEVPLSHYNLMQIL